MGKDRTVAIDAGGLGLVRIEVPAGATPITPASRITVAAVDSLKDELSGLGIDWGTGVGPVAIAAAKVGRVRHVIAIDIDPASLAAAQANAHRNGVANRISFIHADGLAQQYGFDALDEVVGGVDFLIANPPGSTGDDGLGWRRAVLDGALRFLRPDASVFLQVSAQYGRRRIEGLAGNDYHYGGIVVTSGWERFDLDRDDLRGLLDGYVSVETGGGLHYEYGSRVLSATQAAQDYASTGESPLTKWQVHRFDRTA